MALTNITLAGGGHAHLAVLRDWATKPLFGTRRRLVTPSRYSAYSGMLPGWMAGQYKRGDLLIDLEPLASRAGAALIYDVVTGLNPTHKQLTLSSGTVISADILSLAAGGEIDTAPFAALGSRALPVRPVDAFMDGWEHILGDAERRRLAIIVIGGGAAGFELAMGAKAALASRPHGAHISLITPPSGVLGGHSAAVRKRAHKALQRHDITVHYGAAAAGDNGALMVGDTQLECDYALLATGSRAPAWLRASGLECSPNGFALVNPYLQSLSDPAVFAAGDISARQDRSQARSGVHAVKAGPVLAHNIRSAVTGAPMHSYMPRKTTLGLMFLPGNEAILSYGPLAASGHLPARLKRRIDEGFIARHRL